MATERDYTIGKGKPPQHTRFQKGQSGNPKGRRKGLKNVATLLEQVLDERVMVTENGKRKSITKLEAMLKQLANKAVGRPPGNKATDSAGRDLSGLVPPRRQ